MAKIQKFYNVPVNEIYPSLERKIISLSGKWELMLDPENQGAKKGWMNDTTPYNDQIVVPGCLEAQGKGITFLPPTSPGWAGTCDMPYLGVSWHRTHFNVEKKKPGKRLMLHFGGVATDCDVYLNDAYVGRNELSILPFGFDVSDLIREGENTLAVRVENNHSYDERGPENHHGFGSSTMEMRWAGIYRDVELVEVSNSFITDVYCTTDINQSILTARFSIEGDIAGCRVQAQVRACDGSGAVFKAEGEASNHLIKVPMPGAHLWSDSDPFLYVVELTLLSADGTVLDAYNKRFGFREITCTDDGILLNGIPVYLRGDMTHYHWPNTFCTPTDYDEVRKGLSVYKQFGSNFLRHHTYFPSPEYLDICDEIGLFSHNELGLTGHTWVIEDPYKDELWQLAIKRDRSHPAVIIWCMGNEDYTPDDFVEHFAKLAFECDDSRLVLTDSPGWFVFPDGSRQRAPIAHEVRHSGGSYLDCSRENLYNPKLRPWRIQFTVDRVRKAHMEALLPTFTRNTQLLQQTCRKIIIEDLRANSPNMADRWNFAGMRYCGYQMNTFRDSGSFLWGTVDDFFQPKSTLPEVYKEYNNETVLLWAQKWSDRIFDASAGKKWIPLSIMCSHYGRRPIENGMLQITIHDAQGALLYSGQRGGIHIACGELRNVFCDAYTYASAKDGLSLPEKAQKLKLTVSLTSDTVQTQNHWDLWMYPSGRIEKAARPIVADLKDHLLKSYLMQTYPFITDDTDHLPAGALLLSDSISDTMLCHLENGGRVFLTGTHNFPGVITEFCAGRSEYSRGTIIFDHPCVEGVAHEGWCDLPFARLMSGTAILDGKRNFLGYATKLDEWPEDVKPIIQGIPSYKDETPHRLAHLFEFAAGNGFVMATTLRFGAGDAQDAFSCFFLDQLLRYMLSDSFQPQGHVSIDFLKSFIHRKTETEVIPRWGFSI